VVTDWIDRVCEVWGTIDDGKGGKLRSYRIFERAEYPESLSQIPCVLTIVPRLRTIQYSAGGPNIAVYEGVSEFHLTKNVSKGNYPSVFLFFDRILQAAAANLQLGGVVDHFLLRTDTPIEMGVLRYGSEEPHLGMIAHWSVKEKPNLVVKI